jgi:hypothetical protein
MENGKFPLCLRKTEVFIFHFPFSILSFADAHPTLNSEGSPLNIR